MERTMNIGIPKECRPDEFRVGISPVGVRMLRGAGHPLSLIHISEPTRPY